MGGEAGDDRAVAGYVVDVGDALAAAVGAAVFEGAAALAVAVGADGENEFLGVGELQHPLGAEGGLVLILLPRCGAEIGVAFFCRGVEALENGERDDLVLVLEGDAANARGGAALEFAYRRRFEADRLAVAGREERSEERRVGNECGRT